MSEKDLITKIQRIYQTTDLDYDDISERFGIDPRRASVICRNIKKVFTKADGTPRYRPKGYTDAEYELYRFCNGFDDERVSNE